MSALSYRSVIKKSKKMPSVRKAIGGVINKLKPKKKLGSCSY